MREKAHAAYRSETGLIHLTRLSPVLFIFLKTTKLCFSLWLNKFSDLFSLFISRKLATWIGYITWLL